MFKTILYNPFSIPDYLKQCNGDVRYETIEELARPGTLMSPPMLKHCFVLFNKHTVLLGTEKKRFVIKVG